MYIACEKQELNCLSLVDCFSKQSCLFINKQSTILQKELVKLGKEYTFSKCDMTWASKWMLFMASHKKHNNKMNQ